MALVGTLAMSAVAQTPARAAAVGACATTDVTWTFSNPLTLTTAMVPGTATQSWTTTCWDGGSLLHPVIISNSETWNYTGNCEAATFTPTTGTGLAVLVGGVAMVVSWNNGSPGTTGIASDLLFPSPGVCNESTAVAVEAGGSVAGA
jgi:hypothetical protein